MGRYSYSDFWMVIHVLCIVHSASVTGGQRTPIRNADLPGGKVGAPHSRHLYEATDGTYCGGKAADLVTDLATQIELLAIDLRKFGFWVKVYDGESRLHAHDRP